jgi:hypothetical protein
LKDFSEFPGWLRLDPGLDSGFRFAGKGCQSERGSFHKVSFLKSKANANFSKKQKNKKPYYFIMLF